MKIFISAGDISGDIHASNLITAIKKLEPNTKVNALGGENLKRVSENFLENLVILGGFGFLEPIRQYKNLKNIFNKHVINAWKVDKPDKVILVDYYGFNIHIAKYAKKLGIPVYYYIGPQIWASRYNRIKKLSKYVSKMLTILPFEEEIYKKEGIDVSFVGHPLLDLIPETVHNYNFDTKNILIGLFPGSRATVVKRHLPIMLKACELINKSFNTNICIYGTNNLKDIYQKYPFEIYFDRDYTTRQKLTIAISVSGTVSLENTLLGIPMIIMYKLSYINYMLTKFFIRVPWISMTNILLRNEIIPELIQDNASPENISDKVINLLRNPKELLKMREILLSIRKILGNPGVSERAAKLIIQNH